MIAKIKSKDDINIPLAKIARSLKAYRTDSKDLITKIYEEQSYHLYWMRLAKAMVTGSSELVRYAEEYEYPSSEDEEERSWNGEIEDA